MGDGEMYKQVEGWLMRAGIDPLSITEVTVRIAGGSVVGFDTRAVPGGMRFLRPPTPPTPRPDQGEQR